MDGRKNNKGTSGNNGGRKPKSEELELLETISKAGKEVYGTEPYKALWGQIWKQAQTGSKDHQNMILQYTYGKPKQIVSIEDNSLQINITKGDS
jgi:hypothetical protein